MKMLTALAAIAILSATHAFGATNKLGSTNAVSKLDALKGQYDAVVTEVEDTLLRRSLDALTAYGKGLTAVQESLQKQGKLDAFLLVQTEKKRFDSEKSVLEPSGKAETAEVDRLIGIYKKALATVRTDQMKSMLAIKQRYAASLDRLVKEYMLANEIEQASKANCESKRVQAEIAALQSELSAAGLALKEAKEENAEPIDKGIVTSRVPLSLRMGLVLYYSFDRDENGNVTDSSGKKNNGKVIGAQWTPKGKVGGAYHFLSNTEDDNRIVTPDSDSLDLVSGITLSLWVKVAKWVECARLIEKKGESNAHAPYLLALNTSANRLVDFILESSGGGHAEHLSGGKVETDSWRHIVGTYDSRTGDMCLYMNGILDSRWKHKGAIQANANDLYIGYNPFVHGERFDGLIDEVMIFSRALSGIEIKQIYDSQE